MTKFERQCIKGQREFDKAMVRCLDRIKDFKLNEIEKDKFYILQVDVGDIPKETVANFMNKLKEKLEEKVGPDHIIYVPSYEDMCKIDIQTIDGKRYNKIIKELDRVCQRKK